MVGTELVTEIDESRKEKDVRVQCKCTQCNCKWNQTSSANACYLCTGSYHRPVKP